MKYKRQIDKIHARGYSRDELNELRKKAQPLAAKGDDDARALLREIDHAGPSDTYVVFMGFCPGADLGNRLDTEWRRKSICTFVFYDSVQQSERFAEIRVGDLVILKKRHQFGKTMQLFGHGRVTGIDYDPEGHRFLKMNWSPEERVIEVPLMGCNSTVDVRTIEQVEGEMPDEFFTWLETETPSRA